MIFDVLKKLVILFKSYFMGKWYTHRYYVGYDSNGVYHDDPHGLFYVLLRGFFRLMGMVFWQSPALFTAYALLEWIRRAVGGMKGLPGWAFPVAWLVGAVGIAYLMI